MSAGTRPAEEVNGKVRTGAPAVLLCALGLAACGGGPDDEGEVRGLVLHDPAAFDGYTLFSPTLSTNTYLVDIEGRVVHTWASDLPPGNVVELTDEGQLFRCARLDAPAFRRALGGGGRIRLLDWDGDVVWEWTLCDEEWLAHHDIEPLPNGNVLVLAWERKSVDEALAVGRAPDQVGELGFWSEAIFEVRPVLPDGGEIVWEWHAWDHMIQDRDESKPDHGSPFDAPHRIDVNGDPRLERVLSAAEREQKAEAMRKMRALGYLGDDDEGGVDEELAASAGTAARPVFARDWLHANYVDYHPDFDLIMISVREFSELWVIDHSTTTEEARESTGGRWGRGGDLLYRWGNPQTYGLGDESDREFFVQHNTHWIPDGLPGAGNVLVFNNGDGRPGGSYSSVDEIVPPFDPEQGFLREDGKAFGPNELAWTYAAADRESFFSFIVSSADRLPNGNTLVCDGTAGRLFEVTREGRIVWDYLNPFGAKDEDSDLETLRTGDLRLRGKMRWGIFRATRIPPDHPGLAGRDLSPIPTPARGESRAGAGEPAPAETNRIDGARHPRPTDATPERD